MSILDERGIGELRSSAEHRPTSQPRLNESDTCWTRPIGWDVGRMLDARDKPPESDERKHALRFSLWRHQRETLRQENRGRLQSVLWALLRYQRAQSAGQDLGDLGARLAHAAASFGVQEIPRDARRIRELVDSWDSTRKERGEDA